jgi:hypothetical protein
LGGLIVVAGIIVAIVVSLSSWLLLSQVPFCLPPLPNAAAVLSSSPLSSSNPSSLQLSSSPQPYFFCPELHPLGVLRALALGCGASSASQRAYKETMGHGGLWIRLQKLHTKDNVTINHITLLDAALR